jgi:hypothetical protein
MKRRFTTILVTEQNTEDDNRELDEERLHDQIIDSVLSDTHSVTVVAVKTIIENWDPQINAWVIG